MTKVLRDNTEHITPPNRPLIQKPRIPRSHFLLALFVVIIIGYFVISPLLYLLGGTFTGPGGFTLENLTNTFARSDTFELLWNTAIFGIGAAILATIIGTILAFLVARTDVRMKSFITAAALVPLIIPGILHTVAWLMLLSPDFGAMNLLLAPFGLAWLDISSMAGMIFVQGIHTVPLVFLLMLPAFKAMDPSLEEAAAVSGSNIGEALRKITFPMLKPAIWAALLIAIVNCIEGFEVPLILGGPKGINVLATKIWYGLSKYPADYAGAGAYSMLLVILTVLGSYFYSRFSKEGRKYQTVTGKAYRPRTIALGRWKWLGTAFVGVYFFLAVICPTAILIWVSGQPYFRQPRLSHVTEFTLKHYTHIWNDPSVLTAFTNSLWLSVSAATIIMLLMALAAWVVIRSNIRGRWAIDALSFVPLSLPGVVLGVALIFVYLRFPVPIYGTIWILLIAYITLYLPYGMRYASSAMLQISPELEEASQISGANVIRTLRKINLPLLIPGLLGGWIFIVVSAIRQLSTSLLVYAPGNEVLPVKIWAQYSDGQYGALSALGTLMIMMLVLLVLLLLLIGRRTRYDMSLDIA